MLRLGFCIKPLKNANKSRGVGVYTRNLMEELKKRDDLEVTEFEDEKALHDVDLVHFPFFDLFFPTLPIIKKYKTIVTIHDVMPLIFPKNHPLGIKGKINFLKQKLALKSVKKIVTVSQTSKKDIIKYLKIQSEKISVIYEAANPGMRILSEAEKIKIKRKFNLPDQFLLYVGDANYVKNLPFLINSFAKLKKEKQFNNLKLVLVGNVFLKNLENIYHPELESLKKVFSLISEYNLNDEIIRPGQLDIDDLSGFYNLATVYVQPSLYEGFGLPILEAMSCGTPVLSSNKASLIEVGGNAPVYFDPRNLEQFVKLLIDILQSRSLQDKLSRLGLKRAQEFSWEKVADETVKIYREITTNR